MRLRLVALWLTFISFALTLTLLVVISYSLWVARTVPAWTLLVNLYLLLANEWQTSR